MRKKKEKLKFKKNEENEYCNFISHNYKFIFHNWNFISHNKKNKKTFKQT